MKGRDHRKSKPSGAFDSFQKKRDMPNKMKCKGKIPAKVKEVAHDFKVIGNVLVEHEYDSETYSVEVKPNPRMVDTDLLFIALKKNSIRGIFISNTTIRFYIHTNPSAI